MSCTRFEEILGYLRFRVQKDVGYYDGFFHTFHPSYINVLDESMMEWFNKYTPGCVGSKPHPFGNERNANFCGLVSILLRVQILEVKDRPVPLGQKEYNEFVKTLSVMLRMCGPIFGSGKAVVLDSGFCVAKCTTELKSKVVYAESLIKQQHYWTKGVPGNLIDTHFEDKEVYDVGMIEARTKDNKLFKLFL